MRQTPNGKSRRLQTAVASLLSAFLLTFVFGGGAVFAFDNAVKNAARSEENGAQATTVVYGYDDVNNRLVSFDAAAPGTLLSAIAITGLPDGEFIGGIDFRPATGVLYALGSDDRIYTINTTSGVATAVSQTSFTPSADLQAEYAAFDFNPVADRIRVVNTAGVNIRINPDTGVAVADTNIIDDPNSEFTAEVTQLAYSNNVAGATTTTAYAIDFGNDELTTLGSVNGSPSSPNSGQLFTVGSLGVVTSSQFGGFDISGATGTAYAALRVGGISNFYTINLSTGRATLVGRVNSSVAGTEFRLDGIAVQPAATTAPARTLYDFDGDKKADASVFRPSSDPDNNYWYIYRSSFNNSTDGFAALEWGMQGDVITPADYDGDGKTDIAVWRENTGNPDLSNFYIYQSSNQTFRFEQFGRVGDSPMTVGDWDNDKKADAAVYRDGANIAGGNGQSYFFYKPSTDSSVKFNAIAWGITGDRPVNGDFDGDGKHDAAVFRPSDRGWYIRNSSTFGTTNTFQVIQFGLATDRRVSGDFDGDGKTDIAVYRPDNGFWYILQSSNGQIRSQQFGVSTDTVAPADYDGDGKTDIAVFRDGVFYILQSTNMQIAYRYFGTAGDIPVASAYPR